MYSILPAYKLMLEQLKELYYSLNNNQQFNDRIVTPVLSDCSKDVNEKLIVAIHAGSKIAYDVMSNDELESYGINYAVSARISIPSLKMRHIDANMPTTKSVFNAYTATMNNEFPNYNTTQGGRLYKNAYY
jgi:hypothetical protein